MKYSNLVSGIFLERPNRFIAHVLINGTEEICHVKNTGRCRELLVPGCTVHCSVSGNPGRKTKYDLIAAVKRTEHGTLLINMDSQAPNAAVKEWLESGASPFGKTGFIKPECRYGKSRFDFYLECGREEDGIRRIFLEVKGVTLEQEGAVLFPDAPTERGVRHLRELVQCRKEGFETYVLFVVQMDRAAYFTPNRKTHPQFADALTDATKAGVVPMAYTCTVTPDGMTIDKPLPVRL